LWDSMLAEGRGWWITSNSDSHFNFGDTLVRPPVPGDHYDGTGKFPDPVDSGTAQSYADFWPGQFSRTVVGAPGRGYRQRMEGIRAGRVWVCLGGLIEELEVSVFADHSYGWPVTFGGRLQVRRGDDVTIVIKVRPASRPNDGGFVPRPARVDLIQGAV